MSPGRTRLGMAGTTRLELATSAVTVSGLSVLSTTWKSTDGTASHWKYVVDNVNVYRGVYRAYFCQHRRMARYFRVARDSPIIGASHDFQRDSASILTLIQTVL